MILQFIPALAIASPATAVAFLVLVLIIFIAIACIPYWVIAEKAGYSGWLSLLMLVPLVNVVMLWVFAFSEWPALRRAGDVRSDRSNQLTP